MDTVLAIVHSGDALSEQLDSERSRAAAHVLVHRKYDDVSHLRTTDVLEEVDL